MRTASSFGGRPGILAAAIAAGLLLVSCAYPFQDKGSAFLTPPSGLAYPSFPSRLPVGQAMGPISPSLSGKALVFSVTPALPGGLSLDPATGVISGTPSSSAAYAAYRVTAANPAGVAGTLFRFGVGSATVVLAGSLYDSVSYSYRAALASGANLSNLPGGSSSSYARAVAVLSGAEYAAGYYYNGTSYAPAFWKDGARTDLPFISGYDAEALGIAVDASHVYATGYYSNAAGYEFAALWVDSDLLALPVDSTIAKRAQGCAVALDGGHVYVAGYWWKNDQKTYGPDVPCYWLDSTRVDLPIGSSSLAGGQANAIAVDGGTVYCAGYWHDDSVGRDVPSYWRGTTRTDLGDSTSDAEIYAVAASNGHVYCAGYRYSAGLSTACYWADGVRHDLAGDGVHNSYATSIAFDGTSVYVGGYWYDASKANACYWVDGARSDLDWNPSGDAEVFGLALK